MEGYNWRHKTSIKDQAQLACWLINNMGMTKLKRPVKVKDLVKFPEEEAEEKKSPEEIRSMIDKMVAQHKKKFPNKFK